MVLCAAFGCNNRSDRAKASTNNDLPKTDSSTMSRGVENTPPDQNSQIDNANDEHEKVIKRETHLAEKLTFHSFPEVGLLRDSWVAAFNRDKACLTKYSKLCSAHFKTDCFEDSYWLKVRIFLYICSM